MRIFPNEPSALRLITTLAMEQSEEWETGRQYINTDLLADWSFEREEEAETELVLVATAELDGEQK